MAEACVPSPAQHSKTLALLYNPSFSMKEHRSTCFFWKKLFNKLFKTQHLESTHRTVDLQPGEEGQWVEYERRGDSA